MVPDRTVMRRAVAPPSVLGCAFALHPFGGLSSFIVARRFAPRVGDPQRRDLHLVPARGDAPSLLATLDRSLKEIAIHDSRSFAALGSELGAF